jgi:23S rRNA (cytidine1920-2'-O)/16S rRNA (cytidine1409-2'-O)-methyltransferase
MAVAKYRLDTVLLKKGLVYDIKEAQALIALGEVQVNGEIINKAGMQFNDDIIINIKEKCPFVSRGGYKLAAALDYFKIDPHGLICADIGASTGGFTDCLLQRGAKKIYAVDVGYGQFDWRLRQDERVILLERFNARKLTTNEINDKLALAVLDLSFISITKLILPLLPLISKTASLIGLIKPQFELAKKDIPAGGVVSSTALHQKAIDKIVEFAAQHDLGVNGVIPSPIKGAKGNKEFLIHLCR